MRKAKMVLVLTLATFSMVTLTAVASAAQTQDVPEDLEDQPIICTEGIDCPGDPQYVPLPSPDVPDDLEDQPEASPPVNATDVPEDLEDQPEVSSPVGAEPPPGASGASSPGSQPREEQTVASSNNQTRPGSSSSSGGSQSKIKAKELPRTGGTATTTMLILGTGILMIGGGLLARRLTR